jgi:hemerythrin
MSILWREEMSIDQGVIDHDHQTLITIINEFIEAAPGPRALPMLERIIAKLEHYAVVHFTREEALQRAAQYIYLDAHHHEHGDLIKQIMAIRRELAALAPPPAPSVETQASAGAAPPPPPPIDEGSEEIAKVHSEMAAFLHHWLVDHIIKSDLRMKPYAARMAPHAATMKPLATAVTWV